MYIWNISNVHESWEAVGKGQAGIEFKRDGKEEPSGSTNFVLGVDEPD